MSKENLVWVGFVIELSLTIVLTATTLAHGGLTTGTIRVRLANQKSGKQRSFDFAEELLLVMGSPEIRIVISENGSMLFATQLGQKPSFTPDNTGENVVLNLVVQHAILAISRMGKSLCEEKAHLSGTPILPSVRQMKGRDCTARFKCPTDLAEKIRATFL